MNRNEAARAIATRFVAAGACWPNYTNDLSLEGLGELHARGGEIRWRDFLRMTQALRGRVSRDTYDVIGRCYFSCLPAEMYRLTGDSAHVDGLVDIARAWRETAPRTHDGLAGHRHEPEGALLLDMLAGYAPLMAVAGRLSGDDSFYDECARQITGCHLRLRCAQTGLWHHAHGWGRDDPDGLSPAGWGRGQGWALRAMVKSLEWLPARGPQALEVHALLDELLSSLAPYQTESGLWRQVVWCEDSPEETSGSGLIAHALRRGFELGVLGGVVRRQMLDRALSGLCRKVDAAGVVAAGCVETPPLPSVEDYVGRPLRAGDPHAQAAVLLALA